MRGHPDAQLVRIGILDGELVLRAADTVLDRQVLHRLHVQRDAFDARHSRLQIADHVDGAVALRQRLQIDQHPAAVQRRIGAVDADERRQALDRRVLQDDGGECLLPFRHRGKRHRLRRLGDSLDRSGVLDREKSLRNENVQDDSQQQRDDRDDQRRCLPVQHPVQHLAVALDQPLEDLAASPIQPALLLLFGVAQEARGHHRRQGQRHDRRNQDRYRQSDRELAKEPADDVAHEQQGDQHGDQRDRQRNDRESDLLGALERGGERLFARLDVAGDVLDHHDRVVDDEAGRDRQCHQRQIVDREAGEVHHAERADQRQRHGDTGDHRRREAAQEEEYDHHDQRDREEQLELHVVHRRPYSHGAVGQHRDVDRGGQRCLELRQQLLDPVDDLDHVGAGLALYVDDDRRQLVRPGGKAGVFGAVDDVGNVGETDRRAIPVSDDHAAVFVGALELVVGVDRRGPRRPVEAALGLIGVGIADRGAHIVQRKAVGRQRGRIGLDAHRRPLSSAQGNQPHPRQLRQLGREPRIGQVFDLRQRQRLRRQRERHDRRVRRIHLVVDRRRRKIGGKEAPGSVDRRLHFLLGDVERKVQIELQRDDRGAAGAGRRHLLEPRHLSELPLERRGDRRGGDVGAGARIERHHLYRRIVDLRQRRNRQHAVGDDARKQDSEHQ